MPALAGTPFGASTSATGASTATATRPGDVPDGALLIAWVTTTMGTLSSAPGWTQLGTATSGSYCRTYLLWRRAGASQPSYAFTGSAGGVGVAITPYAQAKDPVAGDFAISTGMSRTLTVPEAGCWVASGAALSNTNSTAAAGGDTLRFTAQGSYSTVVTRLRFTDTNANVAAGSITKTYTGTSNVGGQASFIIAIRPAGASHAGATTLAATTGLSVGATSAAPAPSSPPVQVGTPTVDSGDKNTLTLAAPAGVLAGDQQLVVVAVGTGGETFGAAPPGWILWFDTGAQGGSDTHRIAMYVSGSDVGAASFTKSGTRLFAGFRIAWRGGPGIDYLTAGQYLDTAGFNHAFPTQNTAANRLVVGVGVTDVGPPGAVVSWTKPATYDATALNQSFHGAAPEDIAFGVFTKSLPTVAVIDGVATTDVSTDAWLLGFQLQGAPGVAYSGDGALSATTGLVASAQATAQAGAVLAAAVGLAAAVRQTHRAAAAPAAVGALSAAGTAVRAGAAALAATSTLTATATRLVPAAATLPATTTLSASPGSTGAATLSSSTGITAAARQTHAAAATLPSSSTLTAAATQTRAAAATLPATSTLTTSGTAARPAAAALSATTALVASAAQNVVTAAALAATTDLSASAGTPANATIPATTALTATARQGHAVAAQLGATTAVVSAAGQGHRSGTTIPATSALSTAGTAVRPAAAGLGATSTLTADGRRVHPAAATLEGGGALVADARIGYAVTAQLGATSTLGASTYRTQPIASPLAALSAMSATVWQRHLARATITALSGVGADGRRQQPAAATSAATSTLVATLTRIRPAAATLSALSALGADGRRRQPATVSLGATSTLIADASVLSFTGALNPSVWAIEPGTGNRIPLPHFTKMQVSPVRNGFGKVVVEYPVYGRNFYALANNITADRDLEVEVWLVGKVAGAMRAILSDTTGDDVAEDAVWTFEGSFLEVLTDEVVVWPQEGAEKRELIFTAANAGTQVATVMQQGQARGALAGVTRDFTTAVDSAGVAWARTVNIRYAPGSTLFEMLGELVELGMVETWRVTGGRTLQLFQPGSIGVDRTVGTRPVIFRRGQNLAESPRKHTTRPAGTAVLVAGSEGLYDSKSDATALARRGRRVEVFGSSGGLDDLAALAAYRDTFLQTVTPSVMEVSHGLAFAPGQPRPFLHFERDDYVWSDTRGYLERLRVQQWTVTVDGVGRFDGAVVLNTLLQDRLVALARRLKRISSGAEVVGTSNPPEVEDTQPPAAPLGLTVSSTAVSNGATTEAVLNVGWTQVTTNADGTAADDVAGYRVEVAYASAASAWALGKDVDGAGSESTSFGTYTAGVEVRVRVKAYDRNGNTSAPSATVAHVTSTDTSAPPTPSTPVLTSRLGVILADWNGLSSVGGPMPLDLDFVEVHVSNASGFTPTTATYWDRISPGGGTMPITDRPYGQSTYVRFVAVDKTYPTPLRSAASAQASDVVEKVVGDDILDGAVGSLKLADLAVVSAKIGLLAVNDANVGNLSVGKLTAGTFSAAMTISGIIRTAASGRRMEIDGNGWRSYNTGGTAWASLDVTLETMTVTGTYQSGLSGERIRILPDGTQRFYPATGTDYAELYNDGAILRFRSAQDGSGRRSYVHFNPAGFQATYTTSSGANISVFDLGLTYGVINAPVTGIRVQRNTAPADGTQNRFHMLQAGSSGDDANSVIHYYGRRAGWTANTVTDNIGVFRNAVHGNGILMGGASVAILGNRDDAYGPFTADGFSTPSSGLLKTRPVDLEHRIGASVLDLWDRAPAHAWQYLHDLEERPARPGFLLRRTGPDGAETWEPAEWARPQPAARWHFGPIAEDLEAVSSLLVHRDELGRLMVDNRDLLGVTYAGVGELVRQVRELADRVATLEGGAGPVVIDGEG